MLGGANAAKRDVCVTACRVPPSHDAYEIDSYRREHMLQVRFGEATVTRRAQPKRTNALRQRAFNARAGIVNLSIETAVSVTLRWTEDY